MLLIFCHIEVVLRNFISTLKKNTRLCRKVEGEGGGLSSSSEFQKRTPGDTDEETTKQTVPDIWEEARMLRDMVELRHMEARLKDSKSRVDGLKTELITTKIHLQQLQRENSGIKTYLKYSFTVTLAVYTFSKIFTKISKFVTLSHKECFAVSF
ncbi:hypothetical protein LDENG_00252190 [Lucifuga dentata]|nr:hypothetical protein LDENG_00252190 [Lucifuga dentata]